MTVLPNGNIVVTDPYYDAGAVTWGSGTAGVAGPIAAENSVRGAAAGGGASMVWIYDHRYPISQLVVGRPADNIVTLFKLKPVHSVFLPVVQKNAR